MISPLLRGVHRCARTLATALLFTVFVPDVSAQQAPSTRVFTGFTLIDGAGAAPVPNAVLVVRAGRIVDVGPATRVPVPADADRVDLAGTFVMPGLVNAHGHASSVANLRTYAAYGVTTVYSLGDEAPDVFAARDAQTRAAPAHARVYVAGPVLNPTDSADAVAQVAAVAARGVDIVKIRVDDNLGTAPKMRPEVFRAVIREAHARGKRVAVHVYYLEDARALLDAGADLIAHSVRDRAVDPSFVQRLRAANVCYTPTLMREVSTFVYDTVPAFFGDSLFLAHADREWMATVQQPQRMQATRASTAAQRYRAQLPTAIANMMTLFRAGVPIAMGTDTGPLGRFQGYFELMELEMMVEAGLSPMQAIRAATGIAADCLRIADTVGTLQRGRAADLLVLHASPLAAIGNIRRQHSVWVGGTRIPN